MIARFRHGLSALLAWFPGTRRGRIDPAAVFDPGTYQLLFADDAAEGRAWLEAFLVSAVELTACIKNAAANADLRELLASAHQLAGAALSAGAMRLGLLASGLAQDAAGPAVGERVGALTPTLRSTQKAIGRYLAARVAAA